MPIGIGLAVAGIFGGLMSWDQGNKARKDAQAKEMAAAEEAEKGRKRALQSLDTIKTGVRPQAQQQSQPSFTQAQTVPQGQSPTFNPYVTPRPTPGPVAPPIAQPQQELLGGQLPLYSDYLQRRGRV